MYAKVKAPEADEWTKTSAIYLCENCGEELGFKPRKHCLMCSSASGREKLAEENREITKELNSLQEKRQWIYQ